MSENLEKELINEIAETKVAAAKPKTSKAAKVETGEASQIRTGTITVEEVAELNVATESVKPEEKTKPVEEKPKPTKSKGGEKAVETAKVEKVVDPVMDFEIDPKETYKFRTARKGYRQMIPSSAVVFDEVQGCPVRIQLTDTEDSPYVTDHSEAVSARDRQLCFVNGELNISGTNAPAIRYLLAYDGFAGKKTILPGNSRIKGMYTLEVDSDTQKRLLAREELKQRAKGVILDATDLEVENFLLSRGKSLDVTGVKVQAIKIADIAPELVISSFGNPITEVTAGLMRSKLKGTISVVDKALQTPDGKTLFSAKGRNVLEEVALEILSGSEVGKRLTVYSV